MAHAFDIKPLDATFGAVVTGIKLATLDDLYRYATTHGINVPAKIKTAS